LAIVLFVLLSLLSWPLYCLSFCSFSLGYCRTNNTMAKREGTKGQTTQWPREK
jgi:hypothetical protein